MSLAACATVKIDPIPGDKIGMVLMHGKGGTNRYVWSLGLSLRSAGILVETPLMPWSKDRIYDKGYEESMLEIDSYVARLKAAGAKRVFVAGHSIGANAALGYAARREGLSGVILLAYGHVPGIPGFAYKLSASTAKAEAMIAAGKGEETTIFSDVGGGGDNTVFSTANDLFSWFDPDGPATIANNAAKVKPGTPVLCIDGSSDRWQRCGNIMWLLPDHPKHRTVMVSAGHLDTPSSSIKEVADWIRALK
jgi:pimeloyl-ACP methyl ester carboxylesterase